ncbi:hypothetical protein ACFL0F_00770 [Patescibacteria group bacterium]
MIYLFAFLFLLALMYFLSRGITQSFSLLFFRITKNRTLTHNLLAISFLPGIFLHEIAHFLMALILFVPVGQIELKPEILEGGKVRMGSVPVAKTDFLRRFFIGVAPLIVGVSVIFLGLYYLPLNEYIPEIIAYILTFYLVFAVGNTMFMSKSDMEGSWVLLVFIFVIVITLYFLGVRISINPESFISNNVTLILKQGVFFFSILVGVDLLVLILFKRLKLVV